MGGTSPRALPNSTVTFWPEQGSHVTFAPSKRAVSGHSSHVSVTSPATASMASSSDICA